MTLFELKLIELVLQGKGTREEYNKVMELLAREIKLKILDPRKKDNG